MPSVHPPTVPLLDPEQVMKVEAGRIMPLSESGPWALCLSGGGIRSATFALGALQGLAKRERLFDFHYLSTVSGGGYIGGWLMRWIRLAEGRGSSPEEMQSALASSFAHPTGGSAPDHNPLERLRAYSNYLSPTAGLSIDSLALAAIFLRNLFLNWLVWVPLLVGAMALPRLFVALLVWRPAGGTGWAMWAAIAAAFMLGYGIAYVASDLPGDTDLERGKSARSHFFWKCFVPIVATSTALTLLAAWSQPRGWTETWWHFAAAGMGVHCIGVMFGAWRRERWDRPTRVRGDNVVGVLAMLLSGAAGGVVLWYAVLDDGTRVLAGGQGQVLTYATAAVPGMLGCFWLAMTLYTGLLRRRSAEDDREWWARAAAWWLGAALLWAGIFALVIYLPLWIYGQLSDAVPAFAQLWAGGAAAGILTSLIGYWSKHGTTWKNRANSLVASTGMRLLDLLAWVGVIALMLATSLLAERLAARLVPILRFLGVDTERVHYFPASGLRSIPAQAHVEGLLQTPWPALALLSALCLMVAASASYCLGANTFSLHALYGNRLVRAYLGASRPVRNPHWFSGFDPADDIKLGALRRDRRALYPIINIALNLVKPSGRHMAWQQRKAAAFIATPLHCGSPVTGYVPTAQYGDSDGTWSERNYRSESTDRAAALAEKLGTRRNPAGRRRVQLPLAAGSSERRQAASDRRVAERRIGKVDRRSAPLALREQLKSLARRRRSGRENRFNRRDRRLPTGLSLGRAVTISGAAASPNMGYHSSRPVTLMMTWFNVRLGWWLANPGWGKDSGGRERVSHLLRGEPTLPLIAALDEALGRTSDERDSIYLSDGGHFENLGLYEMVRRRCVRIVVVDATCDPEYAYDDLIRAVRKIRVDLGVSIELPNPLPGPKANADGLQAVVVGRIDYPEVEGNPGVVGHLYLLKPMLSNSLPPEIARYASVSTRKTSVFPHQSTSDQFFDETQFESYRLLGYRIALGAFEGRSDWPPFTPAISSPVESNAVVPKPVEPSGLLQAFGDTASLAAAATLAGTAGVVGTLALAPPGQISLADKDRELLRRGIATSATTQVSLSEADRALLSQGIALRTGPLPEFGLSGDVTALVKGGLTASVSESSIVDIERRLRLLVDQINKPDKTFVSDLKVSIDSLTRSLEIHNRNPQSGVPGLGVTLTPAQVNTFERAASAIERLPGNPGTDLQKLVFEIAQLRAAINARMPIHGMPAGTPR